MSYKCYKIHSIYELNIEKLSEESIRFLLFDLDNTLVPEDDPNVPVELFQFFEYLKQHHFSIAIVSNNKEKRVKHFAEQMNVPYLSKAKKPSSKKITSFIEQIQFPIDQTALIGDRLFTDVLAAKNLNTISFLVDPCGVDRMSRVRILRWLENKIVKFSLRKQRRREV